MTGRLVPGSVLDREWEFQPAEEDLAMSNLMPDPENASDQRDLEPGLADTGEFAKMRAVMRASEKHREGGVDPDLDDEDADPAS